MKNNFIFKEISTLLSFRGSVYTDGDDQLVIEKFNYDGRGPDYNIFFYIVNSSYPYSPSDVERGYKNSEGFKVTEYDQSFFFKSLD